MKVFDKWICSLLILVVLTFITIPLISIHFGIALSKDQKMDPQSEKLAARIQKRQLDVLDADLLLTYDEALSYCRDVGHTLPSPTSQEDEDRIIANVVQLNATSCENFFLGFKQNIKAMYRSLDGKTTWPSLDISKRVATPTLDRDCVEFSLRPIKLVRTVPCRDLIIDCMVVLHAKEPYCEDDIFTCVDNFYGFKHDIVRAFNNVKKDPRYRKYYGVAFIDPDNFPKAFEESLPTKDVPVHNCYALAAKQTLSYFAPDGKDMNYKSKNFEVIDSEYACLGIKQKSGKLNVATMPCDVPSCVMCD